jgi:hypothetical protein
MSMVFPIEGDTERSARYLTARRLQIENGYSGPCAIDVRHAMLSWQVAMRVSAVEVYLQNALTFLAVYDAEFMRSRGSKQEWDYDAMRLASDNDDAIWTFCERWARTFVGDGGPLRWSKALQRSGLGQFDDPDVIDLEAMWGYRHMRIHHAGQFTREFIQRHRGLAERLWSEGLKPADVERWSAAAGRFVDASERGIADRLKARLGAELIEQRQHAEFERQLEDIDKRHEEMMKEESDEARQARISKAIADAEERFALMQELFGPAETDPP